MSEIKQINTVENGCTHEALERITAANGKTYDYCPMCNFNSLLNKTPTDRDIDEAANLYYPEGCVFRGVCKTAFKIAVKWLFEWQLKSNTNG